MGKNKQGSKIKKKCKACGTVNQTGHAGECEICTEDDWTNTCEKHPSLNLGEASVCQMCEMEKQIEKFENGKKAAEERITEREKDWGKERRKLNRKVSQASEKLSRLQEDLESDRQKLDREVHEAEVELLRQLEGADQGRKKLVFVGFWAFAILSGAIYVTYAIFSSLPFGNYQLSYIGKWAAILIPSLAVAGTYTYLSVRSIIGKDGGPVSGEEKTVPQMLAASLASLTLLYWGWGSSADWGIEDWGWLPEGLDFPLRLVLLFLAVLVVHKIILSIPSKIGLTASSIAAFILVYYSQDPDPGALEPGGHSALYPNNGDLVPKETDPTNELKPTIEEGLLLREAQEIDIPWPDFLIDELELDEPDLITEGKVLFQTKFCFTCHQTEPAVPAPAGIALKATKYIGDFWGKETLVHDGNGFEVGLRGQLEKVVFGPGYFYDSLKNPTLWVARGALAPMPPPPPLTDGEIKALMAYVKSLSKPQ